MPATLYISVHDSVRVKEHLLVLSYDPIEGVSVVSPVSIWLLFPDADSKWSSVEPRAPSLEMAEYVFSIATV